MTIQLLIDAIVRQTTVLIAQLATAAGLRATLAHTANQVFLDLVRELKAQGLGNKVIADMFGLALSTYHSKVRRLSESRTERGRSLWEVTLAHLREHGPLDQPAVLNRFKYDDESTVRGVLNDLVESGIVFRSGRGDRTTYRAARPEELSLQASSASSEGATNLVWLAVHRIGRATMEAIANVVPFEPQTLQAALEELTRDGRVQRSEVGGVALYQADQCVIPLGESGGWEAALFDHYQAVVTTICTKLRLGQTRSGMADIVGGSTYGFTVWPDHPHHDEVLGLLARGRKEASALRIKVRAYNDAHPAPPDESISVIAYLGQTVIEPEKVEREER